MHLPGTHTGPHALQDFLDNEGFEETGRPGVTEQGFAGVDVQKMIGLTAVTEVASGFF